MALKVEVIANQTIKPSSPTPNHLTTFKFSVLDQLVPISHVPLVLFYSGSDDMVENGKRLDHLMRSLSKTLTQYYHLAGRIEGNDFITCNDEGINFFKARVNVQLNQLLNHPNKRDDLMQLLLPVTDKFYGLGPKMLLSIQANIFDCGAMALGVCITHKAYDASSISFFLNSWASIARGSNDIIQPIFDITPFFPPKEGNQVIAFPKENQAKKIITKTFIFDECNIAALKDKCSSSLYIKNPSRVESVIALLWMCAMKVVSVRKSGIKPTKSVAVIAVNLRGRMIPPLSNNYVGNLAIPTTSMVTSTTESNPKLLQFLVGEIRKAITKFDSNYLRKIEFGDGVHSGIEAFELLSKNKQEIFSFSSWCRFPFYEIDFGWGKPTWASSLFKSEENAFMLMDTICGKGIEARISLVEEDMYIFEREPVILAFTSDAPKF